MGKRPCISRRDFVILPWGVGGAVAEAVNEVRICVSRLPGDPNTLTKNPLCMSRVTVVWYPFWG